MAMQLGPGSDGEDDVVAAINTTPLVDVMLVLLIIFLITIPVVTQSIAMSLPKEANQPRRTKPENIEISVDKDGAVYWNAQRLPDPATLLAKLKTVAAADPQPEVHIRGDERVAYQAIGRVVYACQRAAIRKIGFVTEPPAKG